MQKNEEAKHSRIFNPYGDIEFGLVARFEQSHLT